MYLAKLNLALLVPRQNSSLAVMQDPGALSLKDAAKKRLLGQLIRLHETNTGKSLLEQVAQRSHSRRASTLRSLRFNPSASAGAPLSCSRYYFRAVSL